MNPVTYKMQPVVTYKIFVCNGYICKMKICNHNI